MRVVITGAAGKIGSQLVEELSGNHELCLIDRRPVVGHMSIIADLSKSHSWTRWRRCFSQNSGYPRWTGAFKEADVVLHLAVDQRPTLRDRQLFFENGKMTLNLIEAAVRHGVSRIVFASSNWAVKGTERELAPSCYLPDGPKIGSEAPPRPITSYGLAKAFGEISGRMAVDKGQLGSFVAVRIGSFLSFPPEDERRTRWIGVQDIRSLLRRCVEAQFSGFHVVYGVSAQRTAPYDLSHTRKLLCWQPQLQP
jgi:uronate dehydrogenase